MPIAAQTTAVITIIRAIVMLPPLFGRPSGKFKNKTGRQRSLSAFTRPEATAAWSAAKSRSFWSAYV
ncbi:MAG: hypothetical protein WBL96_20270, partial [Pseudolabrys sp.]